jgi:hypothetical protein
MAPKFQNNEGSQALYEPGLRSDYSNERKIPNGKVGGAHYVSDHYFREHYQSQDQAAHSCSHRDYGISIAFQRQEELQVLDPIICVGKIAQGLPNLCDHNEQRC